MHRGLSQAEDCLQEKPRDSLDKLQVKREVGLHTSHRRLCCGETNDGIVFLVTTACA